MNKLKFLFQIPIKRADFTKLGLLAVFISTIDGIQSYYLQQISINPFQEANAAPFSFYHFGFLGYMAYIPIESVINFAMLSVFWIFISVFLGAIKRK